MIPELGRSPGEGIGYLLQYPWASLVALPSDGKQSTCNVEDLGLIPGLERSPGGGHGNLSPVFLPGESPWIEEPGRLQFMGSQRVRQN